MAITDIPEMVAEAIVSIEDIGGKIESVFAQVGGHLGHTHTIFADLNSGLSSLSQELSGSKIGGASSAFQDIAARLRRLADILPMETALLGSIGTSTAEASKLLALLLKHIHQVTVIARSSRIEAASLDGDRGDFLSFTKEASDLATSVQASIVACSKDQEKLSGAIAEVLHKQLEFDRRYRDQLLSVSAELVLASSEIVNRQAQSAELAELAKASTSRIGGAVGNAILSLQAGDSTRQRLEHICHGLRKVGGASLAPGLAAGDAAAPSIVLLQAAQLQDAVASFGPDMDSIKQSLTRLSTDSANIVGQGHQLYGGESGDTNSFLGVMKQSLARASVLLSACGHAKQSVDASLSVLEDMLGRFRAAILALDDTVVDIILIGMNAGLKAGHLGVKARAFVVIANELKLTADLISASAKSLEPVLSKIGQGADQLKGLRLDESSITVAELENQIMQSVREIESGNAGLGKMMDRLTRESAEFESIMADAKALLTTLGQKFTALPELARRLKATNQNPVALSSSAAADACAVFDELYVQYTMDAERHVHFKIADDLGLARKPIAHAPAQGNVELEDIFF
jgi:hypothetical protein